MSQEKIVELDVRPILKANQEPFQVIMQKVAKLQPDETFVLHATFNPLPLLNVMKKKGYEGDSVELAKEHWQVTFRRANQ